MARLRYGFIEPPRPRHGSQVALEFEIHEVILTGPHQGRAVPNGHDLKWLVYFQSGIPWGPIGSTAGLYHWQPINATQRYPRQCKPVPCAV